MLFNDALIVLAPILSTIEHSSGAVNAWRNRGTGGPAWDALGAGGTRPALLPTGGRFGGPSVRFTAASAHQLATGAVAANQPMTIVVVTQLTTEIDNMTLVDGRSGNTRRIYYVTDTLNTFAGTTLNDGAGAVATATWYKMAGVFNGASSIARRDALSTTGNAGAAAASGLVIGDFGIAGGAAWNGDVEWVLGWTTSKTTAELTAIFAALG